MSNEGNLVRITLEFHHDNPAHRIMSGRTDSGGRRAAVENLDRCDLIQSAARWFAFSLVMP
jgi:hypothetical protein